MQNTLAIIIAIIRNKNLILKVTELMWDFKKHNNYDIIMYAHLYQVSIHHFYDVKKLSKSTSFYYKLMLNNCC